MHRIADRWLRLGIALALVVSAVTGAVAWKNITGLARAAGWVAHTQEVLAQIYEISSTVKDAETGQRGYLLTLDSAFLAPYTGAVDALPRSIDRVAQLTGDNPVQQQRIGPLRALIARRFERLRRGIETRQLVTDSGLRDSLIRGTGRPMMDSIRGQLGAMEAEELRLLRIRTADNDKFRRMSIATLGVSVVIELLSLLTLAALLRRYLISRDRAERGISEQKERFRTTLASIGDGVITTSPDARVTYLNPVAESLTGWQSDDAAGNALDVVFRIVNEDTREPVQNPAVRALREGIIVGLANHTVLIAKDGTERPIDDSAAPIRGQDGSILGSVLVFRDVTARRENERSLRLEARRKDEFIAVLAHELRNPLAPLRNSLEIMRLSQGDPATVSRAREVMERQLQQMVRLIDDLLDVSRIATGRLELRQDAVDLRNAVKLAVETWKPVLDARHQALTQVLTPEPLCVAGDIARLSQAIGNLLSNAAKYSPENSAIQLSLIRDADHAEVRVRDHGIGIAADQFEQIFEMFARVTPSPGRTQDGLGIGLALARRIVELHHGTLHVRSDASSPGSEFIIRLPVVD